MKTHPVFVIGETNRKHAFGMDASMELDAEAFDNVQATVGTSSTLLLIRNVSARCNGCSELCRFSGDGALFDWCVTICVGLSLVYK